MTIKFCIWLAIALYTSFILAANHYVSGGWLFYVPVLQIPRVFTIPGFIAIFNIYMMIWFMGYMAYIYYWKIRKEIRLVYDSPIVLKARETQALYKEKFEGNADNAGFRTINHYVQIDFKKERTRIAVKQLLGEFGKFIPPEKFRIIEKLLHILEEFGEVSSVSRYFGQKGDNNIADAEFQYKGTIVYADSGLTTYDVLATVNLYTHTMDVFDEMIKVVKESNPKSYELVIADAIIVALAHDIGKIRELDVWSEVIVDGEAKKMRVKIDPSVANAYNHAQLSAIIYRNLFPVLDGDTSRALELSKATQETITKAIEEHHNNKNHDNRFIAYIVSADSRARAEEVRKFVNDRLKDEIVNKSGVIDMPSKSTIYSDPEEEDVGGIPMKRSKKEAIAKEKAQREAEAEKLIDELAEMNRNEILQEPVNIEPKEIINPVTGEITPISVKDEYENSTLALKSQTSANEDIPTFSSHIDIKANPEGTFLNPNVQRYIAMQKASEPEVIDPIPFNIEPAKYGRFINTLKNNINKIANENKLNSLMSISDSGIVYFSIAYFKRVMFEELYPECLEEDKKGAAKFLVQWMIDKKQGSINWMNRDNGLACMSVTRTRAEGKIDKMKKWFCVAIDANKTFGLGNAELERLKTLNGIGNISICVYENE